MLGAAVSGCWVLGYWVLLFLGAGYWGTGCCCFWVLGAGGSGTGCSGAGGTGCCWVLGAGIWGSDSGKDCRFEDTLVTTWNGGNSVESCSSCYIVCKEGMRFAGRGTESNYGHGQTRNRAFVTRFWVCRVKWSCRVVTGGSGCGLISQRWREGHAFANARPGSGVWGQKPETKRSWLSFGPAW